MRSLRRYADDATRRGSDLSDAFDRYVQRGEEAATLPGEAKLAPEEGLDHYAAWLARRLQQRLDAIVVVTGPRGYGKSTVVQRLGRKVARLLGERWSTPGSLIYTPEALLAFYERALESDANPIGWVDEGGRVLYNRDFGTASSKAIVKTLTQIRELSCVLFICLPNLAQLDLAVRTDLACLWVACRRRGLARVHLRDERLRYEPESNYGFAVASRAPYLTWRKYPDASPQQAEYAALKRVALREGLVETKAVVAHAAALRVKRSRTPEEAAEQARRLHRERNRAYYKRQNPRARERPNLRRS